MSARTAGPRRTAEIRAEAIKMRRDGVAWSLIGRRFGVKKEWLKDHVMRHADYKSAKAKWRKELDAKIDQARELRSQGQCWKLVARQLGIENHNAFARAVSRLNKAALDGQQ